MRFGASDAAPPTHPAFRLSEGAPGLSTAADGFEKGQGQGAADRGWQPRQGRLGAGKDEGLGTGRGVVGTAQNSLSSAGEDLDFSLLPGLGPLLNALLIKPGPTGSVKSAAPSRGGLRGKMAPV